MNCEYCEKRLTQLEKNNIRSIWSISYLDYVDVTNMCDGCYVEINLNASEEKLDFIEYNDHFATYY